MRGAVGVGLLHDLQQFLGVFCGLFDKSRNLDAAVFVLENVEYGLVVEQIQAAAAVDLEVADDDSEILLRDFIKFGDDLVLDAAHGEGLAGAGLPVGEAGHDALLGQQRKQGLYGVVVDVLAGLGRERATSS